MDKTNPKRSNMEHSRDSITMQRFNWWSAMRRNKNVSHSENGHLELIIGNTLLTIPSNQFMLEFELKLEKTDWHTMHK